MRIGAFLKQSFIDWEGKTSAVIFTKGCNFRCPFCHNPELVIPELVNRSKDIEEKEVLDYLESRSGWLDAVVITGGEPCMHNDIGEFILRLKALGFPVKLDTNGSYPSMLESLIKGKLIDFVAMDIKTVLETSLYAEISGNHRKELIENIKRSLKILRESPVEYQLRTTIWERFHTKEIIESLKKEFSQENYTVQMFRNGNIVENYL